MKPILTLLRWLLKGFIFFTLFAFALNNQQEIVVHFFFGNQWRAPLVLVVLAAFASGLAIGALAMVPRWWRRQHRQPRAAPPSDAVNPPPATTPGRLSGARRGP